MPVLYLLVFVGGGFGAVARLLLSGIVSHKVSGPFPWPTLTVNLLGAFVIGALTTFMALKLSLPASFRYLLVTGFLGGFTTFSAFTLESMLLLQRGQTMMMLAYICASVIGSLILFYAGEQLIRVISS